ncbi:P-loop containing nucleoside triphosphate hydrolase protein [Mycena rosella]|uniref:P-loop containing nucleoside triphosphate hydrolase protein n=1 Tax=Mycena rosella TaxID=1033263 RepID=A0AAD7GE35_MYCRO|nr:P-loop containing nucleoside triphosphate hydrolase protein [Mycena rosella]
MFDYPTILSVLIACCPAQVTPIRNHCPPPSRIFHGRQMILHKMHDFFARPLSKQHIFLLHGLGGAGKTQIAFKFLEESSSRFSDIFLIDTSTTETIDTGLKNITPTDTESTAQNALQWLSSRRDEWLLLFDNADDPKIDLHKFFPHCNHGNILITSRNPGLQVYAASHSQVSDMEEEEAIELLLMSASQNITPDNQEIAGNIALWYLPLAIIQAGAFISKSGALDTYLTYYTENRARLLSEKPAQSHDDYAWTVYTTWQISFEKLSTVAATLLQLCSSLHHEGISEQMFSWASLYQFPPHGPSKNDLQQPLKFLSQFLGPGGIWDSLRFMDVMNEIRAYSLVAFDIDRKIFSIHPLVHSWSQSILPDENHCHSMVAIVGMSITSIPREDIQLVALGLLPHVDSLLHGSTKIPPHFGGEYAKIYYWVGRLKDAENFEVTVLSHRMSVLGEDHPVTLNAMAALAATYTEQGKMKQAEKLELTVLKKRRTLFDLLGADHPDTLLAMGNLASTYQNQGHFKEAEALEVVVFEKRKNFLGEDHPDTLHAMSNLAWSFHRLGQLEEAEHLESVVVEKRLDLLGDNHPDTLCAMAALASTYIAMAQFNKAEQLEFAVFEKRKRLLGESHEDTLHAMSTLASILNQLGRYREAEQLYIQELEKRQNCQGEDHPDTLRAMGNLPAIYFQLGKLKEAKELSVTVLNKRRSLLGENHPDTLWVTSNMASTCYHLRNFREAEQLYLELLAKQRALLGPDHPDTLATVSDLAATHRAMGQ